MKKLLRCSKKSSRKCRKKGRKASSPIIRGLEAGKKSQQIINALDRTDLPMAVPPQEGTPLPEFPCEFVENYPIEERQSVSSEPLAFLSDSPGLWDEIRKVLAPRQFEVFQLHYRLQMPYYDIAKIMNIKFQTVYDRLAEAEEKLKKHFGGEDA